MTTPNAISEIKRRLISAGIASGSELRGCSEEEIESLEAAHGARLPGVYREFLRVMGRQAGEFFRGTDLYYPAVRGLSDEAVQLLRENGVEAILPKKAFVFMMHQGYEFDFFLLGDGDDPSVFHYREGEAAAPKVAESLSEYLLQCVSDHETPRYK